MPLLFIRYRIVTMPAPGIAGQDAFKRQPSAFQSPVFLKGLHGILRAGRGITALCPEKGRQELLVQSYNINEDLPDHREYKTKQSGIKNGRCFTSGLDWRSNGQDEFDDGFFYRFFRFREGQPFFTGENKKAMQLCICINFLVKGVLLQAPGFFQQAAYPVAVYRFFYPFFRDAETHAHGRRFRFVPFALQVNYTQRKNRKRLSCMEKRFNLFTQLQPFDRL